MTISKFYLHEALSSDTGSLPTTSRQSPNPTIHFPGRSANDVIGTLQTNHNASLAGGSPTVGPEESIIQFLTDPVAVQTIVAGTWTFSLTGNRNSALANCHMVARAFAWRPSSGTDVATIGSGEYSPLGGAPATNHIITFTGSTFSVLDNDILIFELNGYVGTSTSCVLTYDYDGTVDDSATDAASYVIAPSPIIMFGGAPPEKTDFLNVSKKISKQRGRF